MKDVIKTLSTLVYELWFIASHRVKISKTEILLSRIVCQKGNRAIFHGGELSWRSSVKIHGSNNTLQSSAKLTKSSVSIEGENNTVILEDGVSFAKGTVFVKGNNLVLRIGSGTSFNTGCWVVCMGQGNTLEIGEGCMMADNVDIWNTDSHPIINDKGDVINTSLPIKIGNHVWLGKGSKVLKGVTIGDNAIVGMGSTVTKDITAATISVGTPAKIVHSGVNWIRKHTTC